jgi:Flp pilus assembly protein CpaB
MKKNLAPLLGIAFVVALVATGVFYGLVASRLNGTADSTGAKSHPAAASGPADRIPNDMRVVSVRVSDSSGVVTLLRPGSKVDVQVVALTDERHPSIRTVTQNVEIMSVSEPDQGRPVVNMIVSPEEADVIGLADSTAKIRLSLRAADAVRKAASPATLSAAR